MTTEQKEVPQIPMCDCKSSQVSAHGYDAATKTLAVRFGAGGTYHYHNVPPDVYVQMQESDSIGSFLHKNIKGKFEFKKI